MSILLKLFCFLRELQNPREQLPLHGVPTSAWHRGDVSICQDLFSRLAIVFDCLFAILSIAFSRKKKTHYSVTYKVCQIIMTYSLSIFYFCGGPFLWTPLGTCPVCPVLNPALTGSNRESQRFALGALYAY